MNQSELIQKYGKGPFFLGWHEIRQLIFEHLPDGIVDFNSQVSTHCCVTMLVTYLLSVLCGSAISASALLHGCCSWQASQQTLHKAVLCCYCTQKASPELTGRLL